MTLRLASFVALAATFAANALAQDIPMPKVMAGVPPDQGSWRIEALEMPGPAGAMGKAMGPMTICQTAAKALAGDTADKGRCQPKLVQDSAQQAVIDTVCPPPEARTMRTTITRAGPQAFEMATVMTERGKSETMRARMTYLGTCTTKDAVVSVPKTSPMCQRGAAQMASVTPEQACKGLTGAQREGCVQQIAQVRAQFEQMCK